MRTVRSLAAPEDRLGIRTRFPSKALALSLALVIVAFAVWSLVDRVVPAPPRKPAAEAPAAQEKAAPGRTAADKARAELLRTDPQPFSIGSLLAVGGVLCGAVVSMLVLKRILKGTRSLPSGRKLLQVRDVLALGPKRAIYLIGLENRNLVVGSSGDELTLLSEYSTEQDDAAPARAMASREPAAATLPAAAAATGAVPARLDVEVGGEIAVPSEEAAATAPGAPAHPRAFSFAALQPNRTRAAKAAHPERVPHKFRQLLEQATGAEESAR